MPTRPPNTLGFLGNYIGTAGMGFNQYLEHPVSAVPSIEARVWAGRYLTFTTLSMGRGIVDHVHYIMQTSGAVPTVTTLASSPVWQGDMLVLTMPESNTNRVYMLAHDAFHRPVNNQAVTVFGAFWVDITPPTGSIKINNGDPQTNTRDTKLHIKATDNISGVAEMFIDGDIDPTDPYCRHWMPYSERVDALLTETEGKKIVTIKFKDYAGNISKAFLSSIIYPLVRYFFNRIPVTDNRFDLVNPTFIVQTDNRMGAQDNRMKEGSDHGNFNTA